MRALAICGLLAVAGLGGCAAAEPYHLISGAVPKDTGPDGNTVILDAPRGLIVFDTGRHPEHAQAIIAYAKQRKRPIAAIINSHWHLDHITGNWDIRQAYPRVEVYASNALEGALTTFLKESREGAEQAIADPQTPPAQRDQLERGLGVIDHPERIRPDHIVSHSGMTTIAGRRLDIRLAKFAATEGDVWVLDPKNAIVIVGDLVVDIVPFMDTACADGWAKALDEIAAAPFTTLIPGHGASMSRTDFMQWRTAYIDFVACGHSAAASQICVDRWMHDAAKFIDTDHREYVPRAAAYYLDTRLRSAPEEQERYCKSLGVAANDVDEERRLINIAPTPRHRSAAKPGRLQNVGLQP
jgi:glyoxylase-like metal-dependent hydrolase (beta-lactamase superfamily II)